MSEPNAMSFGTTKLQWATSLWAKSKEKLSLFIMCSNVVVDIITDINQTFLTNRDSSRLVDTSALTMCMMYGLKELAALEQLD